MEKILINSVEKKFGKPNHETGTCTPFWAIVFNHTSKATVWDEAIATHMLGKIGGYVMATLTPGTFKGQPIMNIREIATDLSVDPAAAIEKAVREGMPLAIPTAPQETNKAEAPNPQRVGLYIKLAVEMAIAAPINGKNVEENLCENIQEIKKLEEFTIALLSR